MQKNINFSEILKICKIQIKEFYLILINEFYKTSEILDFQKFWQSENSSFGFYVPLKVGKYLHISKNSKFRIP